MFNAVLAFESLTAGKLTEILFSNYYFRSCYILKIAGDHLSNNLLFNKWYLDDGALLELVTPSNLQ